MYTVYIIECRDGTLYTGITTDLNRRMQEHRNGVASRYTAAKGFHALRYQETQPNRSHALIREHQIKQLSRSMKLQLICSYEQTSHDL